MTSQTNSKEETFYSIIWTEKPSKKKKTEQELKEEEKPKVNNNIAETIDDVVDFIKKTMIMGEFKVFFIKRTTTVVAETQNITRDIESELNNDK